MAARRDKTRSTYFVIGSRRRRICTGTPFLPADAYPARKAWTVCQHLASPEKALAYQREAKPILIVHGFILCQECNHRNLLTGQEGLNAMIRTSLPKDDSFFQQFILRHDIPDLRCDWAMLLPGSEAEEGEKRLVCPHLDTPQKLLTHYASRNILFWHQDTLLCGPCLEALDNGQAEPEERGRILTGRPFSEQVVAPLCAINAEYFGFPG